MVRRENKLERPGNHRAFFDFQLRHPLIPTTVVVTADTDDVDTSVGIDGTVLIGVLS
jgi:hypothetical protein